jgi:hypothetical protein
METVPGNGLDHSDGACGMGSCLDHGEPPVSVLEEALGAIHV